MQNFLVDINVVIDSDFIDISSWIICQVNFFLYDLKYSLITNHHLIYYRFCFYSIPIPPNRLFKRFILSFSGYQLEFVNGTFPECDVHLPLCVYFDIQQPKLFYLLTSKSYETNSGKEKIKYESNIFILFSEPIVERSLSAVADAEMNADEWRID